MGAAVMTAGLLFLDCIVVRPPATVSQFTHQEAYEAGYVSLVEPPPLIWMLDEAGQAIRPISASYPTKKYLIRDDGDSEEVFAVWPSENGVRSMASLRRGHLEITEVSEHPEGKIPQFWSWILKCSEFTMQP